MIYISRTIDKNMLIQHKEKALRHFSGYMDGLISSDDSRMQGKADKLSYWMDDWTGFLEFEPSFTPTSLRRYKRGEILKVHLGFNIESEEGGLHYAVILDKNNSVNSPVVPLTSAKPHVDVSRLHKDNVFLGNELFTNLSSKISALERIISNDISEIQNQKELELLARTRKEISRMKSGSIALVGQIRTISKIRIYDPKTNYDVLSGVKLSNEKLNMIDHTLISLYTNYQNEE